MLFTNRVRLALVCLTGIVASTAMAGLPEYRAAVQAEPSLISHYTFDSDTTAVTDTGSGGHHGTLQGTAAFSAAADALGGVGQALALDGSGWVNFGVADLFNYYDSSIPDYVNGTIEVWVRPGWNTWPGPVPEYNPTVACTRNGGDALWSMHVEAWLNQGGVWLQCQDRAWTSYNFHADKWYHLVFVYDRPTATSKVYIDGLLVATHWGMGCGVNLPFQLGANSPTGGENWIGKIDEVAVYKDALTSAQVAAHYVAMNGGGFDAPTPASPLLTGYQAAVNADNPLGHYTFDGDTTVVTDSGSVHANGTLVAPTYWTNGFAGGQALGLDISGAGRVAMGPVPAFVLPGGVGTIEAWIAPDPRLALRDSSEGRPTIMSVGDDFSALFDYGLEIRTSDQSIGMESFNDGYHSEVLLPGGLPTTAKWYHVAAVFNGGMVTYYINGKVVDEPKALNLAPPADAGFLGNFQIGAVDPQGDWGFPGKIDEVAIYGTALTPARVAAHYATAALTFSTHERTWVDPTDMTPLDVTLSAPTGQVSSGLTLAFSFDPALVTVTLPAFGLTVAPNTAYPIPDGLASAVLHVTPISGSYGTTTLSVTANEASGWIYSDSVNLSTRMADQGVIYINDDFNNDALYTNPAPGIGGGWSWGYLDGTWGESNSAATISPRVGGWYSMCGFNSAPAGDFPIKLGDGIRVEWVISNVQLTANGTGTWPGGDGADTWHELGVVSASASHPYTGGRNNSLFANDHKGGFYVNLFYSGSNYPTSNIAVSGDVRVVNANHAPNTDGEASAGLETPVYFTLTNVTNITPANPLVVTMELSATGWKVGFSQTANPVYTIEADVQSAVTVDPATNKVQGGWTAASLKDAAIGQEFSTGGFLWMAYHQMDTGNGTGSIDRVKACIGCTLSTDCPYPFADANSNGTIDMADFGLFQACWAQPSSTAGCRCFDHSINGVIDTADLTSFLKCWTGPSVPIVDRTCADH